jgi:hypothetical protein
VDRSVERPVATAVESVSHGLAAAGRDGAGAGQRGEGRVVADSTEVEKETTTWAALTGPMPGRAVNPGAICSTNSCSSRRLAFIALATSRTARVSRRISP